MNNLTDDPGISKLSRFTMPTDVFQLKIDLLDIRPPIWRRLLVRQDVTLPELHAILQAVMGWSDAHLHQFKIGHLRFGEPDHEFEPGPIDHRRITLSQVAPHRGSILVYEYDFGDSWEHRIEVEDELPVESVDGQLPRCLAGERACPPEDVGGPSGFAEFLKALRNPRHPEHDANLEWAGGSFDPEAFDLDMTNRRLATMRRPASRLVRLGATQPKRTRPSSRR